MTDRQIGFLTAIVCCAAFVPLQGSRMTLVAISAAAAVALAAKRPAVFIVACGCAASLSAGAAWAAIDTVPVSTGTVELTLLSDPEPTSGGVRVIAAVEDYRVQLTAWSSAAGHVRPRLMGEVLTAEVRLRPLSDPPSYLLAQGLEGRGTIRSVGGFTEGRAHTRLANSLRRTIEAGAASMSRQERSLFTGLVYGDDREQPPLVTDNFRAVGLTHILAVSGQNVVFVLAIAGPALRRFGIRGRFGFTLLVLVLFATVTRFEPSVVRASVMTAVAAVGSLVGTEVSSTRVLGLAVTGLVLVDPLLVHSVAFQLSVAASAGILFWSGRVARALPGPRIVAEAIAVTASAQLAVAPLLVWRFDGLPVASLPANVIAAPAAGPVMMWGLTGGVLAGLVPSWCSTLLHVPTRLLLWWIDGWAAILAVLPTGELVGVHVAMIAVAAWFGLRQLRPARRIAALAVVCVVLAAPALSHRPVGPVVDLDGGSFAVVANGHTVLVLDASSRPSSLLEELRRNRVNELDTVIALQGSNGAQSLLSVIGGRHAIDRTLAPPNHRIVGATAITHRTELRLHGREEAEGRAGREGITVLITVDGNKLVASAHST